MALYPIKLLKDEKGIPFVPLTQVTAVVGEEYITGILLATKVLNGHYQIINDKINYEIINNKIISVKFPTIEETSVTSYLKLNNGEEYPIYDYEGANPVTLNKLSNTTTFLIFDTDKYKMVKVSTADNVSGGGHTIIDNQGNILPQRPTLTFKGLSVNDDTATGSTVVNGPVLINNLTTSENNKGALDAYQGKVLLDKIPTIIDNLNSTSTTQGLSAKQGKNLNEKFDNYLLKSGGTITGKLIINNSNDLVLSGGAIKGEDGNNLYHAIKIGYPGNDKLDFYEYGGVFNFYKTKSGSPSLIGSIDSEGWHGDVIGKASSSIKAIQDGNGSQIDTTYLKKEGGTIKGFLTIGESTTSGMTNKVGIKVHDLRNCEANSDMFGDQSANYYFAMEEGEWKGIFHMKGWDADYAAWQLAGNATSSNNNANSGLYYRTLFPGANKPWVKVALVSWGAEPSSPYPGQIWFS